MKKDNLQDKVHLLDQLIKNINSYEAKFLESTKNIMTYGNAKLYTIDFLALTVNNRSIHLLKGFELLIRNDYFLCAIPLIRLQLDNALRFFALNLVSKADDFIDHFISGKPIRNYKDSNNKRLTDSYLAERLNEIIPGTLQTYRNLSEFVHLSDQHLAAIKTKNTNGKTSISVGINNENFNIDLKISYVRSMIDVCNLVLINVNVWEKQKKAKVQKPVALTTFRRSINNLDR